jgi:hypothetical protein
MYTGRLILSLRKLKCFAFELASRKQSEVFFPFADVCVLYENFPKRLTFSGKFESRFFFGPANSNAKHFNMKMGMRVHGAVRVSQIHTVCWLLGNTKYVNGYTYRGMYICKYIHIHTYVHTYRRHSPRLRRRRRS